MEFLVFALPVLLLVLMYSSQRKRQRSVEQIQASLQPGQEVVTTSGMFARVVEVDDAVAVLDIGSGVRVRWDRRAIGRVLTGDVTGAAEGAVPHTLPSALPPAAPPSGGSSARPTGGPVVSPPSAPPASPPPAPPGPPARPADEN